MIQFQEIPKQTAQNKQFQEKFTKCLIDRIKLGYSRDDLVHSIEHFNQLATKKDTDTK